MLEVSFLRRRENWKQLSVFSIEWYMKSSIVNETIVVNIKISVISLFSWINNMIVLITNKNFTTKWENKNFLWNYCYSTLILSIILFTLFLKCFNVTTNLDTSFLLQQKKKATPYLLWKGNWVTKLHLPTITTITWQMFDLLMQITSTDQNVYCNFKKLVSHIKNF